MKGAVYANYNDWAFEDWGDALGARALLVSGSFVVAPKEQVTELAWDFDQAEANGDPASILARSVLRTDGDEVAAIPLPGGDPPAGEELLVGVGEGGVDRALAGSPDLPVRFLRELLPRAPEEAWRTLWQARGETP